MRFRLQAKGMESSLSYIQEPSSPPPSPLLCPLSCKLPSAGGWGFLVYQFPSLPSPLPHTYTQHNLCLSSFACVQGPQDPLGQQLGASERLGRILITLEQPQLDSILSDAF